MTFTQLCCGIALAASIAPFQAEAQGVPPTSNVGGMPVGDAPGKPTDAGVRGFAVQGTLPSAAQCANLLRLAGAAPNLRRAPDYAYCRLNVRPPPPRRPLVVAPAR